MKASNLWLLAICTALLTICTIATAAAEKQNDNNIDELPPNKHKVILREGYPLRPENMSKRELKKLMVRRRRNAVRLIRRDDAVIVPSITLPTIETQQQHSSPVVQPAYSAPVQQQQPVPGNVQQPATPVTALNSYQQQSQSQAGNIAPQIYTAQQVSPQGSSSTYYATQPQQQQVSSQNMMPVNYYYLPPPSQSEAALQQQGITLPSISQASLPSRKKSEGNDDNDDDDDDEEEEDEDEEDEEDYDADDLVTKRR